MSWRSAMGVAETAKAATKSTQTVFVDIVDASQASEICDVAQDPEQLDAERRQADRQAKRGYDFDPTAPSHTDYRPSLGHPACSIVRTCRRHGVALRVDPDGTLVVLSNGRAWRSLVAAIEAHVDDVAALVAPGVGRY
jgi:hypothetical protein